MTRMIKKLSKNKKTKPTIKVILLVIWNLPTSKRMKKFLNKIKMTLINFKKINHFNKMMKK